MIFPPNFEEKAYYVFGFPARQRVTRQQPPNLTNGTELRIAPPSYHSDSERNGELVYLGDGMCSFFMNFFFFFLVDETVRSLQIHSCDCPTGTLRCYNDYSSRQQRNNRKRQIRSRQKLRKSFWTQRYIFNEIKTQYLQNSLLFISEYVFRLQSKHLRMFQKFRKNDNILTFKKFQ